MLYTGSIRGKDEHQMPLQPMNRMTTAQTITEYFAEKIRLGEYQSGDRLPSERELMAQLSVARSTIREAMQSLYSRNLIEIRAGEGTFVKGNDVTETLLAKLRILLNEELEMDDLFEAQKLFTTLSRRSGELKEDASVESDSRIDNANQKSQKRNSEISPKGTSPQSNRTLGVLSDLVNAIIDYRQSIV